MQLNQETAAVAQALQSNQALRGQAVSQALQNLTKLAEVQQNDPVRGRQADVLGELIRATVTNIQTGATLGIGSQRLANERLATGVQANLRGNEIQANAGVNLQNQFLNSLGQSANVAQSGQQNYLNAIQTHQNLGMGLLGLAGDAVGSLGGPTNLPNQPSFLDRWLPTILGGVTRGLDWWQNRNQAPERFENPPRDQTPPPPEALPTNPTPPFIPPVPPTAQTPQYPTPPSTREPTPDVHSTIDYPSIPIPNLPNIWPGGWPGRGPELEGSGEIPWWEGARDFGLRTGDPRAGGVPYGHPYVSPYRSF